MPDSPITPDTPDLWIAAHRLASATLPAHRLRALLEYAGGSLPDALNLPADVLCRAPIGCTPKQAERLAEAKEMPLAPRLLQEAAALGAHLVRYTDEAYPIHLRELGDAPPLLWVRGTLTPDDDLAVGIVGSRRATGYGRREAERFARRFAEAGVLVVSGGAAGIDTCAHRGTLDAGGRTVAVLGCGVDVTYPAENRALFKEIVDRGGGVISEFPLGTTPEPWRFPTRNRIIAGMSRATLVVESPPDSGAMITARDAAEYGRDVWAVPGPVDTGRSRGGHKLIQDGAGLADNPEDLLLALGIQTDFLDGPVRVEKLPLPAANLKATRSRSQVSADAPTLPLDAPPKPSSAPAVSPLPTPAPPPLNLPPGEAALLAQFGSAPRHLDEASQAANLSASEATVAATLLEMKRLITRHPGNLFTRAGS